MRPSGFANLCDPVGATIMGEGMSYPNKFIDMSMLLTSTRTRGRNLQNTHRENLQVQTLQVNEDFT